MAIPRHTIESACKIFVGAIPKEGLMDHSLGITPTIKLYSAAFTDYILWSV